ncbi:ribonuclease H-like domain-containing protein [Tanacetum coccineum]
MPANIAGINSVISFCSSRFFNHNSNIRTYKLYTGWIIDSGASQHMTYTIQNMFNVVEVSKLNMTVGHPNGTKTVVTHVGSLRLTDKIVIHDVLVVSGYKVSLLSVYKLSKDNKYRVLFDEDVCVIQDSIQRTQVGTENIEFSRWDDAGHPDDSYSAETVNSQSDSNLRRSSRKTSMPKKLRDFKIDSKVKYSIDKQLDINNAFLYGDLVEDMYMSLPDGYFDKSDTRVYKNGVFIVLLVYVDDIVITCNYIDEINKFKTFLSSKFLIKDLGKLKYFLGIEVLESNGNLYLSQRKYYLELLADFGMLTYKPCGTPIESKELAIKSNKEGLVEIDKPLSGINNYQKLVGKLIYLTHTRPDICYAIHVLSQYMHAPLQSHLKLAFRVLRYLKNVPRKGISFCKSDVMNLSVFVDSYWAKCKATRKSVTGYAVFMGKDLVSWKSKK